MGRIPELYHLPGFHEPFSAITHLVGAPVFLVLGWLLLRRGRGDPARLAFLGIFALSCVILLSMSAVYHMTVRGGTANRVMQRLDHGAIFLLIAASFTPAHGILLRGWLRWFPLLLIWSAAITGITLKAIFFDSFAAGLSLTFYLTLGWFGLASAAVLARRHGARFLAPLAWGGVVYSVGGVIDLLHWPVLIPGVVHGHEIFHLAVLAGAFLHWRFVWQFADGNAPRVHARSETGDARVLP